MNILMVNHNELTIDLLQHALRPAGHRFTVASDPRRALDHVREGTCRLVLCDWGAPRLDALALCRTIRETNSPHYVYIILLAEQTQQLDVVEAILAGADDFLVKPCDAAELRTRVFKAERVLNFEEVRNVEQKLRDREEQLRLIIDSVPALIAYVDSDQRCRFHNRAFIDWTRPDTETVKGRLLRNVLRTEVYDSFQGHLATAFEGERVTFEFSLSHRQREREWFRTTVIPHFDDTKRVIGLFFLATDVTEQKRSQRALLEREEQLRQSQKLEAVGTLAGGVAHEFNNLLQAIRGYTGFAKETLADDHPAHGDLSQVLKAADRAVALTRQLLGFGRRQRLEPRCCDPNEIVGDLLKLAGPLIRENIQLTTSLDRNTGTIHADAAVLGQALLNLCINARDAMPDGGRLHLKTENVVLDRDYCEWHVDAEQGHYVLITVSDTGCGMPREVQDRIFEPFFTTKEVGQGTGLGLAMVHGVVEGHHGMIHVYSEPGQGTTFKLYFPAHSGGAAPVLTQEPVRLARGDETILVAEDEPLVRDLAVRVLESAGYRTVVAANGAEAVAAFRDDPQAISLALLDVIMPEFGGYEVFRRIREVNPHIRAVFSSGYAPDSDCTEFIAKEGLPLIEKPFHPNALLRVVRDVLDEDQTCHKLQAAK